MHGQNNQYNSANGYLSITGIANALDIIEDPDTGEWVCRSGDDGCVPWNIFTNHGTGQVVDDDRDGVTREAIDYSTSGGVSSYKVQASYAPADSRRIRGGYNRAVRAANISELFRVQGFNLNGSTDICSGANPTATQAQCANTGDPALCELIVRDDQGTLWATQAGYTVTTNQNIGRLQAEGVDLNFNYLLGLGNSGYMAMDLMGSCVLKNEFSNPLVDYDCAGYFGFQCGQPISDWRHRFRATWETNFRLNLSLSWRYVGEVKNDDYNPDDDLRNEGNWELWEVNDIDKIDAYNYFDLAASYTLRNGLKFTLGVNNILDEEPPLAPAMADDTGINMYGIYDPAGRYIFGSVQFNF